jgi:hypothetical protein
MVFFEDTFSNFMDSTPSQAKLEKDAKILTKINQQAIIYQNNEDQAKFDQQATLMQEKIKEIATDSLGINIAMWDVHQAYFPIKKGSQVDVTGNQESFQICDVVENIPIHLQKIKDVEMFQMFAKKYSKYEMELNVQDERRHNSSFHYGIQATSDDGKFIASTFFHADSCTNEIIDFDRYRLSCLDKEQEKWTGGTNNPDYVKASLKLEEFCIIPLSSWHQSVSDYQDTISDRKKEQQLKFSTMNEQSFEKVMAFQSELTRWALLSNIVGNIVQDYFENEKTQGMIKEYAEKYGSLPKELQDLLDVKPLK